MLEQIRRRLTYANVMSTIAVFGVLGGGGAYAAGKIGSGDIKRGAVRSKHIKNGTIRARDINKKTRAALRGQRGPAGPAGGGGAGGTGATGPGGPRGGTGATGAAGPGSLCAGNSADDVMVKVGSACIDRFESSIWTARTGGTQITGAIPAACDANGKGCKGQIFARSKPGVAPRASITWFQAQQALANSGKRLPSNADWQMAVAGTPDSNLTDCNVNGGAPVSTGSKAACRSDWGANDMVGNLHEWVADWDAQADDCDNWPAGFGADFTCFGSVGSPTPSRFPGALIRGGFFNGGPNAGPFAVDATVRPSVSNILVGFRGAR